MIRSHHCVNDTPHVLFIIAIREGITGALIIPDESFDKGERDRTYSW